MKTVFDKPTRDELINRIYKLDENSPAQWGKMNMYRMLKHCTLFEELLLGKKKYKQSFIGRLFGKMALKGLLKDENTLKRNMPTVPGFEIKEKENIDAASEKKKWITLIEEYSDFTNQDFIHPFFGKMTKEQIGFFAYKHTDHHLRQFNG